MRIPVRVPVRHVFFYSFVSKRGSAGARCGARYGGPCRTVLAAGPACHWRCHPRRCLPACESARLRRSARYAHMFASQWKPRRAMQAPRRRVDALFIISPPSLMGWKYSRGCMRAAEISSAVATVTRPVCMCMSMYQDLGKHRKLRSACMSDITSSLLPCSFWIIWPAAAYPRDVSVHRCERQYVLSTYAVIKCSAVQHLRGSVHPVADLKQGVRSRACHGRHSRARAMCLSGQPDQTRTQLKPMVLRARQQGRSPPSRTSVAPNSAQRPLQDVTDWPDPP
jgi:hypothetical protein